MAENYSMATLNSYLQLYSAVIMMIILIGNLRSSLRVGRSFRIFIWMLLFDVLMLTAGGLDNLTLALMKGTGSGSVTHAVFSGISDFSYFGVLGLFILYIDVYDLDEGRRIDTFAFVGAATSFIYGLIWFLSDFSGVIYTMDAEGVTPGSFYIAGQLGGYLTGVLTILILIVRWRSFNYGERTGFASFILIPFCGSFLKSLFYGVNIMPLLITVSIVIIQVYVQSNRELNLREKQTELAKLETDLLMSRLKPHFVNNVLNSIYALCDISPERAKDAIARLSRYVRKSFVNADSGSLIFFEEELENTENYLAIEKLRFGDKLEVILDIRARDFLIPVLTIQTIVENAVRHGIEKKPEGGKVMISTMEDKGTYIITVKDTGAGFKEDIKEYINGIITDKDGRKHLGLYSASYRIKSLCGGSLDIKGEDGVGTTVTIRIGGINRENSDNRQ